MKEDIIAEILYLDKTMNLPLETILHSVLDKYTIEPKRNEIVTTDNTWQNDVDYYLKRLVLRGLSVGTIKQYRFKLKSAFETIGKKINEVTTIDIATYLAYQKNVRGASQRYIEDIRVCLNGFYEWYIRQGLIDMNPVNGVEKMKVPLVKVRPFSEEEIERFRKACEQTRHSIRNRAIVELFYSSGIRCKELRELNIQDIDFDRREGVIYNGKGAKERDFYFSDIASYYLKQYLATRSDNEDALFISKDGKRYMSNSGIENIICSLGEIGHIKKATPHRMRHTFITRCVDRGMDVQDVMTLVGHSNIQTTMIYYETNQKHTKEVYGRMFN